MDNKIITLEELIARKEQSKIDKLEYKEIWVGILGGDITVKKLPLATILRMLDGVGNDPTMSQTLELNKELIYKSCLLLQDKKLKEIYSEQITEPYDIVTVILNDNLGEIANIANEIMEFYGLGNSANEIKNS